MNHMSELRSLADVRSHIDDLDTQLVSLLARRQGLVEAAAKFKVRAPLREVGLTKSEIRLLSRAMNLPTADAPAQPCLSSRIPHGTPVTVAALGMIERGEAAVRGFGFRVFRVRHHGEGDRCRARLEIAPNELPKFESVGEALRESLQRVGYDEVVIDPRGYRAPIC